MSTSSSGPAQVNATRRPLSLIAGSLQSWFATVPVAPVRRSTSVTAPVERSFT